MPDFLYDWNMWWLTFFDENPVAFWVMSAAAVAFAVLCRYLRKRAGRA